jgi:hypothetical protein
MKNRTGAFGVIDLAGIRILGSISGDSLDKGIQVKMVSCGIAKDGSVYYDFEPL